MTDAQKRVFVETIKKHTGIFEAYEETTFHCYRNAKDGTKQTVTVRVHDAITESPRYSVEAVTPDGRGTSGNSDNDLMTALAQVHWHKLDEPPIRRL